MILNPRKNGGPEIFCLGLLSRMVRLLGARDSPFRHLCHEQFSAVLPENGTAVCTRGTTARCSQSVDAVDVEEEVLMLALLHKKRYKYWVHPLLCTRLEMGQFYTLFSRNQERRR